MTRILLGQLGANGDCLYTTILARQIRQDHPNAHITWAISSQCAPLLTNNPHIDEVWEIAVSDWSHHEMVWRIFEREATRRLLRHEFDHAFLSQIWPNNFQNFDGTIRPSILRSYGRPITVPIENVIVLTDEEEQRVEDFVRRTGLMNHEHRILFECSPKSGQSFVTPDLAQEVAALVYDRLPSASVVFSTHLPMALRHPQSYHGGELSLRESAALTRYCTLFVGAGSGGTVAATSTAAQPLPNIQLLSRSRSVFGCFSHDFAYWGLPHGHMLDMTDENPERIARCIVTASRDGIGAAQAAYGETIPVRFDYYAELIEMCLIRQNRILDAAQSALTTAGRYGWQPDLAAFARERIQPLLPQDPGWIFPHRRRIAERLGDELSQSRLSQPEFPQAVNLAS
ncbi:glycosyltransferase family 9 protein [Azospirillum thermophilum]|uniref:Glycosyltransferase family 9 protein n=1 Tax=Azospirillum thermophilum TaxID=2202148 RepID=A0A2S2D0B5_9PROT|nr:hypothetical protein [Azospirillum thermophilum]AWK90196.1 hypothetical protein DEW08_29730 [Azospirillum thermophilum]